MEMKLELAGLIILHQVFDSPTPIQARSGASISS